MIEKLLEQQEEQQRKSRNSSVKRLRKVRSALEVKTSLLKREFGLNRNRYKHSEWETPDGFRWLLMP